MNNQELFVPTKRFLSGFRAVGVLEIVVTLVLLFYYRNFLLVLPFVVIITWHWLKDDRFSTLFQSLRATKTWTATEEELKQFIEKDDDGKR